jgi:hypothetical protein
MENKKIKCAFYFQTFLGMVARVRNNKGEKKDLSRAGTTRTREGAVAFCDCMEEHEVRVG